MRTCNARPYDENPIATVGATIGRPSIQDGQGRKPRFYVKDITAREREEQAPNLPLWGRGTALAVDEVLLKITGCVLCAVWEKNLIRLALLGTFPKGEGLREEQAPPLPS